MRFVKSEDLARCIGAVAESVPDLALRILVATEQYLPRVARLRSRDQDYDRFRLGKTREVIEMTVRPVGIVCVRVAQRFGRGRNRGDAAAAACAHFRDQARTALAVVMVGMLHPVSRRVTIRRSDIIGPSQSARGLR